MNNLEHELSCLEHTGNELDVLQAFVDQVETDGFTVAAKTAHGCALCGYHDIATEADINPAMEGILERLTESITTLFTSLGDEYDKLEADSQKLAATIKSQYLEMKGLNVDEEAANEVDVTGFTKSEFRKLSRAVAGTMDQLAKFVKDLKEDVDPQRIPNHRLFAFAKPLGVRPSATVKRFKVRRLKDKDTIVKETRPFGSVGFSIDDIKRGENNIVDILTQVEDFGKMQKQIQDSVEKALKKSDDRTYVKILVRVVSVVIRLPFDYSMDMGKQWSAMLKILKSNTVKEETPNA